MSGEVMMLPKATRADGSVANGMTGLGTFADQMTCNQANVVKVDTDLPDAQLALIGCGVTTGVGAALNTAKIMPGSTVAVIGCGGVGPGGHPGCAHRGREPHLRDRPGGDEAQDRRVARRDRPRRPRRRRPDRAGARSSPAESAPTTRSRSSACPRPSSRRTRRPGAAAPSWSSACRSGTRR